MSFSFRQLRYFIATAESGQVSQAAQHLAISQSAVTAAIKELEQIIGTSLFIRTAQGVNLTPAGREFLSYAYDISSKVNQALHMNFYNNDIKGELTIAATYTVIGYFLPLHIERIKRLLPKLKIKLYEMKREEIEEGLLNRQFDMAVLLTSNIKNPHLVTETLLSSVRRLWVPANHQLLKKNTVKLKDISIEPYIMLTVDEADVSTLKYWHLSNYLPNILLQTSCVEAVRSMVANGLGVAILSDMIHRRWSLEGKRIETINVKDIVQPMEVGMAWSQDVAINPAMQAFRNYFHANM